MYRSGIQPLDLKFLDPRKPGVRTIQNALQFSFPDGVQNLAVLLTQLLLLLCATRAAR